MECRCPDICLEVYSECAMALFNSGAIPNVMSHKMVNKQILRMQSTIPIYQSCELCFGKMYGTLNGVPISMGELVVPIDYLVLEETPYDVLIGLSTMIQLRARPDYNGMLLKIHCGRDSEILNYEYERDKGNTSEDEFTSDSADENEQVVEDSIDELVLMLKEPEKEIESSDEDQYVNEKLSHLNSKDTEAVKNIIKDHPGVIANSFEDVRPSTMSVTHRFESISENHIYQKARRMSPFHNEIVRKEIDRMLFAGIITPVEWSWTSPVVIATKKGGFPRFCIGYQKLNSVIHANRLPLP